MGAAKAKTGWKPVCHRYDHRLVGCSLCAGSGTLLVRSIRRRGLRYVVDRKRES